jgi:hypothetical protein
MTKICLKAFFGNGIKDLSVFGKPDCPDIRAMLIYIFEEIFTVIRISLAHPGSKYPNIIAFRNDSRNPEQRNIQKVKYNFFQFIHIPLSLNQCLLHRIIQKLPGKFNVQTKTSLSHNLL